MRAAARDLARKVPPLLAGALVAIWLLLNETLSPGHLLLGVVLAIAIAWTSGVLRPVKPRIRRAHLALVLLGLVVRDVVQSNVEVARIVLGVLCGRERRSAFVKIPLALTDPHGLAVLAAIMTATPGTVWVDHDAATKTLTLHVLDPKSEAEWIDWVKNRYERLLMEIFE
jgi:multicomponent K+:H+ antiporter subunit E